MVHSQKFQYKKWGIYNLNSILISRVLKILASQNRFQSLYDEIFNFDRFVELRSNPFSLIQYTKQT